MSEVPVIVGKVSPRQASCEDLSATLSELLSILRAQYWCYQTAHWQAKGESFYGDHLLLQRAYEALVPEIDGLAEKLVGVCGASTVDAGESIEAARDWLLKWSQEPSVWLTLLKSEIDLQQWCKVSYGLLKSQESLSLGLDDFIMALASQHETNLYLLGRRVSASRVASAFLGRY